MRTTKTATLIAYADDVALILHHRRLDKIKEDIKTNIEVIEKWMQTKGLEFAKQKTEIAILNRKRIETPLQICLRDNIILISSDSIRYLGIYMEKYNYYFTHVEKTTNKATKTAHLLARLSPNIGSPGHHIFITLFSSP